jgi:hypothetical protein
MITHRVLAMVATAVELKREKWGISRFYGDFRWAIKLWVIYLSKMPRCKWGKNST